MSSIITNSFIVQLIGFVGLGVSLWVFQLNKRKNMLNLQMWGNILFTIHFFLLGAYTGSALNLVGAGRSYAFNKFRYRKWSALVFWGFIAAFGLATALTWQGPISLLPGIGMISGAFAYWQPTAKSIRLLSLLPLPTWFIYGAFCHSYAGMATEVLLFVSILTGRYRLDRRNAKLEVQTQT